MKNLRCAVQKNSVLKPNFFGYARKAIAIVDFVPRKQHVPFFSFDFVFFEDRIAWVPPHVAPCLTPIFTCVCVCVYVCVDR